MPPGLREVTSPIFSWLRPAGPTISGLLFGVALLVLMFVLPGGFVDGARRAGAPRPRRAAAPTTVP